MYGPRTLVFFAGSESLLFVHVHIHLARAVPEHEAEDRMRPETEQRRRPTLIEAPDALLGGDLVKAVEEPAVHEALSSGVRALVV